MIIIYFYFQIIRYKDITKYKELENIAFVVNNYNNNKHLKGITAKVSGDRYLLLKDFQPSKCKFINVLFLVSRKRSRFIQLKDNSNVDISNKREKYSNRKLALSNTKKILKSIINDKAIKM